MLTPLAFEKPVLELEARIEGLRHLAASDGLDIADETHKLEQRIERSLAQLYAKLTPWQRVQVARHPNRPRALDVIEGLIDDFMPLAGDRLFGEDQAIVGGIETDFVVPPAPVATPGKGHLRALIKAASAERIAAQPSVKDSQVREREGVVGLIDTPLAAELGLALADMRPNIGVFDLRTGEAITIIDPDELGFAPTMFALAPDRTSIAVANAADLAILELPSGEVRVDLMPGGFWGPKTRVTVFIAAKD